MRKRVVSSVLGVVALSLGLALASHAAAAPPGTMFFAPEQVELTGDWEARVKKANVKEVEKKDGQWSVFLVAFLRKAPGASEVSVLFYDVKEKGKDPQGVMPVSTQANQKVLATKLEFGDDIGLKPGTYNVVVARKVGGKEEVYARGQLALK